MARILFSFVAASIVCGLAVTLLASYLTPATRDPGIAVSSVLFYSVVALVASSLLGLPWLRWIRNRAHTKPWQIIALGATAAGAPFLFFCLYVLTAGLVSGKSSAGIVQSQADDAIKYAGFFLTAGVLIGLVVWLLGVRGNPYFSSDQTG